MLREILTPRVGELEANRDAALTPGREAVQRLVNEMEFYDDDVIVGFNEHVAFALWQHFRDAERKFDEFRNRHIDSPRIEVWKDEIAVALKHLTDRLNDIHRPASTDQSGEDYSYSDEEWAAIQQRGVAAREHIPEALAAWEKAKDQLATVYNEQLKEVKNRLVELDRQLLR